MMIRDHTNVWSRAGVVNWKVDSIIPSSTAAAFTNNYFVPQSAQIFLYPKSSRDQFWTGHQKIKTLILCN